MAAKKGTKDNPVTITDKTLKKLKKMAENGKEKSIEIIEAVMRDGFCDYQYMIVDGKPKGFLHKVKGNGIIDDDMREAFSNLNVHLAAIDDIFKHADVQFPDIDKMHNDDLSLLYSVTGFKIKGGEENESIILIGSKTLNAGGHMELESPKIPLDNLSSYKWYNELKEASDLCRNEVTLYHEGKYTPVKEEEPEEDSSATQLTIGQGEETDDELEKGKM